MTRCTCTHAGGALHMPDKHMCRLLRLIHVVQESCWHVVLLCRQRALLRYTSAVRLDDPCSALQEHQLPQCCCKQAGRQCKLLARHDLVRQVLSHHIPNPVT
jgi:hypothetical protein